MSEMTALVTRVCEIADIQDFDYVAQIVDATLKAHAERTVAARSGEPDAVTRLHATDSADAREVSIYIDTLNLTCAELLEQRDTLTAERDAARTQCDELAQVVQRVRAVTVHEDEPYSGCGDMYCPGGMSEPYMLADDVRVAVEPVRIHHNQRSA
jgi:hypothetical protein